MNLREIGIVEENDSAGSGWRTVAGFCKHGNEPSVFIKDIF
jgi:hypothetical protein